MPVIQNSKSNPFSRTHFHTILRHWYDHNPDEKTIAGANSPKYKGKPWVWVEDGGTLFHLNSDTTREGVEAYLTYVDQYGDNLLWTVVQNKSGKMNKIAMGPEKRVESGFYFYREVPLVAETVIPSVPQAPVAILNQPIVTPQKPGSLSVHSTTGTKARELLTRSACKLLELQEASGWKELLVTDAVPILWFGNAFTTKPRILTVGANPSSNEFKAPSVRALQNGEKVTDLIASVNLQREVIDSYNGYFNYQPYIKWFGPVEWFLQEFKTSYQKPAYFRGLHVDLFPFATIPDFSDIQTIVAEALFASGWASNLLKDIIGFLHPHLVIVFGRTNYSYFRKYYDPSLPPLPEGKLQYVVTKSAAFDLPILGLSVNIGHPKGFTTSQLVDYRVNILNNPQLAQWFY
jgi:hypothetical protein